VAFCAKDNDTFILWRQTSPPSVSEYSISSSTRTFIYNVPSIADSVSSINLTQNNKLLIKGANRIYQMDYASGNLEMSATTLGSPPIVPNIGGMFEYSGNIYVMGNLSSRVVNYPLTNPFLPKVLYASLPIGVKDVSQIRTYLTVDFIP
jgi:hypothetical protein